MQNDFVIRNKLILVMGMQRSGTTALLYALGQDPALHIENESPEGPIYDNYRLRPEPEIRSILWGFRRRVVLKPVVEVEYRELEEVLEEFRSYQPKVAWIYRDPVNVWSSAKRTFSLPPDEFDAWLAKWVNGNASALRAIRGSMGDQIGVVRYEDLINHRPVFDELCRFLGVSVHNNLFWREDQKKGRRSLPESVQAKIERATGAILRELDEVRLRVPSDAQSGAIGLAEVMSSSHWHLDLHHEAQAELLASGDPRGMARVEIQTPGTGGPADVQLSWGGLKLMEGREYTVFFWARAERRRLAHLLASRNQDPWEELGLCETIELSTEWQPIGRRFRPTKSMDNARVYLDLGGEEGWVEVSDPIVGSPLFACHRMEIHDGAAAHFEAVEGALDAVRIRIDQLPTVSESAVQAVAGFMQLHEGRVYTLVFSARAHELRTIAVSVGLPRDPWIGLGLYEAAEVTTKWQTFRYRFHAPSNSDARLYFDLGQSPAAVEIGSIDLFEAQGRVHDVFTAEGAECHLEFPSEDPSSVRAIMHSPTQEANAVQLYIPVIPVTAGKRYAVTFRARADAPRDISFGVGLGVDPWNGLGLYEPVGLWRTWKTYHFEFVSLESADSVRILFDIGGSDIPAELADYSVEPVDDTISAAEVERLGWVAQSLKQNPALSLGEGVSHSTSKSSG